MFYYEEDESSPEESFKLEKQKLEKENFKWENYSKRLFSKNKKSYTNQDTNLIKKLFYQWKKKRQ